MTMESNPDFQRVAARLPHIAKQLRLLWGTPQLAAYVAQLLLDTRNDTRQGFPPDLLQALLNLQESCQYLHGTAPAAAPRPVTLPHVPIRGRQDDPWDDLL